MTWYKLAKINKFNKQILKKLAAIWNVNYTVPTDKKQMMFDFYALIGAQPKLGKISKLPKRTLSQVQYAIMEIKDKLIPAVKEEMLTVGFTAIASEFQHVFENNRVEYIAKTLNLKVEDVNKLKTSDAEFYKLKETTIKKGFQEKDIREEDLRQGSALRQNYITLKDIESIGLTREEFVEKTRQAFFNLEWEAAYGGKNWGDIAYYWLKLSKTGNSKGQDQIDMIKHIDLMYAAHHNSGSVLDKTPSYELDFSYFIEKDEQEQEVNGYVGIIEALDAKFAAKSPWALLDKCSPTMKRVLSMALYAYGYGTQEDYRNSDQYIGKIDTLSKAIAEGPETLEKFLKIYDPKNITDEHVQMALDKNDETMMEMLHKQSQQYGKHNTQTYGVYEISQMMKNGNVQFIRNIINQNNKEQKEIFDTLENNIKWNPLISEVPKMSIETLKNIIQFIEFKELKNLVESTAVEFIMQNARKDHIIALKAYALLPKNIQNNKIIHDIIVNIYTNQLMGLTLKDILEITSAPKIQEKINRQPALKEVVDNLTQNAEV
jgi:hypothetical protein